MNIPTSKEIKAAHYDRLIKLNDSMVAVNQMMQMFQANAQSKLQQYQAEVRKVWEDIARDNPDLDLININWEPSKEPNTLIPTSMRLGASPQG